MLYKRQFNKYIAVLILATIVAGEYMLTDKDLSFIREVEGCKLSAYQDEGGVWTIGYGHTRGVKEGDRISTYQANTWLNTDIILFEIELDHLVKVDLSRNQRTALLSFIYNIGAAQLADSTLIQYVNKKQFDLVPNEIRKWNKVDNVVSIGLTNRREKEAILFERETIHPYYRGEGWW